MWFCFKRFHSKKCIVIQPGMNDVRSCKYSGAPEYWVETRETGEKGQEREHKKQRKEIEEDI